MPALLSFAMNPPSDHRPDFAKIPQDEAQSVQALQLREVHHRMRNSLHLIACTLQLQSRQSGNAETRHALDIAARRIDSVARVHEHLYGNGLRTGQLARTYVSSLLQDLQGALLDPASPRTLCLAPGEAFSLDSDALLSLGSIVTELVTNAVKYSAGRVRVALAWGAGRVEILVEDEGSGFPPGFDPARDAGFGLRLVHHLCTASGGTLTIDTKAGHGSAKAVLVH
ncbi:hypothetical protein CY652_09175 [Burkholderia sp. WAC0059]|uniref:sensor histidine kinase n=1 Tax=Burkholderia sp. WAC0059 TaxID=2066022 RepID=UPI000C7F1792|nr:sensor histidine kinase [Burkholderia sp. WAC0059]PLZ02697.1 hypothetical protein CY652_09175 [Burkholderia sp. WAC0059]